MDRDEAIRALRDISMVGHTNYFGADWLVCPGCGATANVTGNVSRQETFRGARELLHPLDCPIFRAHTVVLEGDEGYDAPHGHDTRDVPSNGS